MAKARVQQELDKHKDQLSSADKLQNLLNEASARSNNALHALRVWRLSRRDGSGAELVSQDRPSVGP